MTTRRSFLGSLAALAVAPFVGFKVKCDRIENEFDREQYWADLAMLKRKPITHDKWLSGPHVDAAAADWNEYVLGAWGDEQWNVMSYPIAPFDAYLYGPDHRLPLLLITE